MSRRTTYYSDWIKKMNVELRERTNFHSILLLLAFSTVGIKFV